MIDPARWEAVRHVLRSANATSLHVALSTVGDDGAPAVTAIGTLFLGAPGEAYYLDYRAAGLGHRLDADPRVSILAVDAGRLRWLRALLTGRFARPAAVRLVGRAVGASRPATDEERARFARRVGLAWRLPAARKLWGRTVRVRELRIERIEEVRLGALSAPL